MIDDKCKKNKANENSTKFILSCKCFVYCYVKESKRKEILLCFVSYILFIVIYFNYKNVLVM
jgi:hypothetical protein